MDSEKHIYRQAATAVEIGISVALCAIVVIVAISLFHDNISSLINSSNFMNMFKNNGSKTEYSEYARDYANSEVNVQITGAQGLEMLRRKANNKALELINNDFSSSNPYGNSLAYFSGIVNIISGEGHFCAYMKKDSIKHCDELEGGYKYNISINSNYITVSNTEKTVNIPLNSTISSIIKAISFGLDAQGYPNLSNNDKYNFIEKLTKDLKNLLNNNDLLINSTTTSNVQNNKNNPTKYMATTTIIINNIKNELLPNTLTSLESAQEGCTTETGVENAGVRVLGEGCTGYYKVTEDMLTQFKSWQTNLITELNSATSKEQIADIINKSLTSDIINIIESDNYHSAGNNSKYGKPASTVLSEALNNLKDTYGLTTLNIPKLKPNGKMNAKDEVQQIGQTISATTQYVGQQIVEGATYVAQQVKQGAEDLADKITDKAQKIENSIKEKTKSVKNKVKSWF